MLQSMRLQHHLATEQQEPTVDSVDTLHFGVQIVPGYCMIVFLCGYMHEILQARNLYTILIELVNSQSEKMIRYRCLVSKEWTSAFLYVHILVGILEVNFPFPSPLLPAPTQ